jgi:hypothetical protein
MSEALLQLLERMRASRGVLAQQLQQLASMQLTKSATAGRVNITAKQIGIGLGVALAMRVIFAARRESK